jgi:hypothetical protein
MATYTLISSNVLSSSAASVTFSSIPATYTDLVVRISARSTSVANQGDHFYLSFNGSTAASYSYVVLKVANGAIANGSGTGATLGIYEEQTVNRDGTTANTFSNAELYIPNYLVSQNKPSSFTGVVETNTASTAWGMSMGAALWSQTAAITSLTLTGNNTFATGSSFYLYGISNT